MFIITTCHESNLANLTYAMDVDIDWTCIHDRFYIAFDNDDAICTN